MNQELFERRVSGPEECHALVPEFAEPIWLYKYTHRQAGWVFSIATQGEPQSHKLSLGGFRIVPAGRAAMSEFDNDREAISLAHGMGEKVAWSRLVREGGPLGLPNLDRIVGGKCVLLPSADARIGKPRDAELLDFATRCMHDCEKTSGVLLITGQDLGHGTMSDGHQTSLQYTHERFFGSVLEDTSKPTGEGNFCLMKGVLRAIERPLVGATVGLIGCGNVGIHVLRRARAAGATILALDAKRTILDALAKDGVEVFEAADKDRFLARPMDVLVVNALGGTLDRRAVDLLARNEPLAIVCGSENLAMTDPDGEERLRLARKIYCPMELCGLMGYLTAVEEYLSHRQKIPFKIEEMFSAAQKLEEVGFRSGRRVIERDFAVQLGAAVEDVYRRR